MKVKITVGLVLAAIAIAAVLIFFPRQTAPEVRFTVLSGENFSTSELRGKVVLVNFWATYYRGEPDWAEFHEIVERALAS